MVLFRSVPFILFVAFAGVLARGQNEFESPPVNYHEAETHDPIAQLKSRLDAGELELEWHEGTGWLKSLLSALKVPVESQTLVFSKTSLQISRISPRYPRAIYFNDDVYIGWVQQGDVIEASAVDPQIGPVFYTLRQSEASRPRLVRDRGQCLSCHATVRTQNVPGYLIRSVYSRSDGTPHYGMGTVTTGHDTPIAKRFGGWYVTGTHGDQRHRGNVIANRDADPPIDVDQGANVIDLRDRIAPERYLVPTSDIVALMVLEHQSQMHNRITAATFEAVRATHHDQMMNKILERPQDYVSDSANRRIENAGNKLVEYLLFCDEVTLTSPIKGTEEFKDSFESFGRKEDSSGRSLRDLDMKTRLFKYPCSFLIYSQAFQQLPGPMMEYVLTRLTEILTGNDVSGRFDHLSNSDRRAIAEILSDTLPAFEQRWINSNRNAETASLD